MEGKSMEEVKTSLKTEAKDFHQYALYSFNDDVQELVPLTKDSKVFFKEVDSESFLRVSGGTRTQVSLLKIFKIMESLLARLPGALLQLFVITDCEDDGVEIEKEWHALEDAARRQNVRVAGRLVIVGDTGREKPWVPRVEELWAVLRTERDSLSKALSEAQEQARRAGEVTEKVRLLKEEVKNIDVSPEGKARLAELKRGVSEFQADLDRCNEAVRKSHGRVTSQIEAFEKIISGFAAELKGKITPKERIEIQNQLETCNLQIAEAHSEALALSETLEEESVNMESKLIEIKKKNFVSLKPYQAKADALLTQAKLEKVPSLKADLVKEVQELIKNIRAINREDPQALKIAQRLMGEHQEKVKLLQAKVAKLAQAQSDLSAIQI